MKIQNVKGGYDFLPKEQKIRDYINSIIIKNFKEYGFNSIETPILCYYDMLSDKYDKEQRIKGSIAAGGRYDKMIGNFIDDGEEYPCVGISFGLSAIYEILKDDNNISKSETDIYIIPMDTEIESIKIANIFRNKGLNVEVEMNKKKLKKSLDYANKQNIKYVIIIGENEIIENKIKLKNMMNGENIELEINNIENVNFENLI